MKNKNLPQAMLFNQGKKALGGDVSGHTDTEVRKKGIARVIRRGGVLATGAAVVVGVIAPAIGQQNKTSAEQVRQDKAEYAKIVANPGPRLRVVRAVEGAPAASAPAVPESTSATSPESAAPVAPTSTTGEATAPAAVPTEGAWTPTPDATPAPASLDPGATAQTPNTGGMPSGTPDVNSDPQTGGVTPN